MDKNTEIKTILFADIVGSTELYDKLGDAQAKEIISLQIDHLMAIVKNHHGTIIKTIGDEIMCTFDDANQAVGASLAMLQHLNEVEEKNTDQPKLSVKIGFNEGPVIPENGDVFGNAVNLAARMVSQAKAKQIITTGQTLKSLAYHHRECSRLVDRTRVKGIHYEIEIIEILSFSDRLQTTITFDRDPQKNAASPVKLILTHNNKEFVLDHDHPSLKMGRDNENDILCADAGVSRLHCKIELSRNHFVLKDVSTNGTYIERPLFDRVHCRRDEYVLEGSGEIRLGKADGSQTSNLIRYQLKA